MLWLTGLMGMMMLGSVAIFSTPDLSQGADDTDDGDAPVEPLTSGDGAEDGAQNPILAAMGPISGTPDTVEDELREAPDTPPGPLDGSDAEGPAQVAIVDAAPGTPGLVAEDEETGEIMIGGEDTDLLGGAGGDDRLDGAGGDDQLHGGTGADTILGGDDDDTLQGGAGDDWLFGEDGEDALYGHDGDDRMDGGTGNDTLHGGLGQDEMQGGAGDDGLMGREGADTLDGGAGSDTLFGGWDDDAVIGILRDADGSDTDGKDFLNGGDGDDTLTIGQGDIATGGAGADTFLLGDWITGEAAQLTDFNPEEDRLLVVYDDSDLSENPALELLPDDTDAELTRIVVDGQVLAVMPTSDLPAIESIVLMGQSAATALPGL